MHWDPELGCGVRGQWDILNVDTDRVISRRSNCSTPDLINVTFHNSAIFTTLSSQRSTSKDLGPCSAMILPATHAGLAAKFRTNTELPSMNYLPWLALS